MEEFQAIHISYMIVGVVGYLCGYIMCKIIDDYKKENDDEN